MQAAVVATRLAARLASRRGAAAARARVAGALLPGASRAHCGAATAATALLRPGAGTWRPLSSSAAASTTYVSPHYQMDDGEVEAYLRRKKLVCKETSSHFIVKDCPFCENIRGKADNQWKLYVTKDAGLFHCHRCGAQGSLYDMKRRLGDIKAAPPARAAAELPRPTADEARAHIAALWEDAALLAYLRDVRGLSDEVLRRYGVGATTQSFFVDGQWRDERCMTFPWLVYEDDAWVAQRVKLRSAETKRLQRLHPKGGGWGLFGLHTVPADAEAVVLTEGEFDAMAVHQATGLPAVSLPNGAHSLPPDVLPLLERFSRIYLWMDNDVPGQEGAAKFAGKLGLRRCRVVTGGPGGSGPKDANEALLQGADLQALVDAAQATPHQQILSFAELREDVTRELLDPDAARGVPLRCLPSLNNIVKGHRRGELTIFTGPTGSGKTTLLSQISLDLCRQGVNTLWGSFELKNTRLAKTMLTQFAGFRIEDNMGQFEGIADNFDQLPLHFLKFFGSTDVDQVIDAMDHAVYCEDTEHVVIDNLQFMTSGLARAGVERWDYQERALEKLRHFATNRNVHVTLVVHPRKEPEDTRLGMSSVFGTAKATQEADNVLILQYDPIKRRKYIDVKKNRFDGDLGTVPLVFDADSRTMKEKTQQQQAFAPAEGAGLYPFDQIVMA